MHVTLTHDADMADDTDRQLTQFVIIGIAQGLGGSDHDRLTRMDAEWIEVLHVADRDTVVETVAYHLILYLFPAFQTLLDQHLRREREGLLHQRVQLLLVIAEARAQATQRIGGTHDHRIAQCRSSPTSILGILHRLALDRLHANLIQLMHEELAILRVHDGLHRRTQHLDVVFLQSSSLVERHTTVQRRLSTEGQQDAIRTLLLDHFLHKKGSYREEIDRISHALRGLHSCDVRVDQDGLDTLLADRFQCLATGIVELACLTDLQGTGSKHQDFLYIFFHDLFFSVYPSKAANLSNINSVSNGPLQASGWNCEEKKGFVLWRIPSFVSSFILTKSGSHSSPKVALSTA